MIGSANLPASSKGTLVTNKQFISDAIAAAQGAPYRRFSTPIHLNAAALAAAFGAYQAGTAAREADGQVLVNPIAPPVSGPSNASSSTAVKGCDLRGVSGAKSPPRGRLVRDDAATATDALMHIPVPAERGEWIRLMLSAKRAGVSWYDFNAWSSEGPNYENERRCQQDWKGISEDGAITPSTLFSAALAAGWQSPSRDAQSSLTPRSTHSVSAPTQPLVAVKNEKADAIWNACVPALLDHPYVLKKEGSIEGLRCYPANAAPLVIQGESMAGWLAVPCWSDGLIQTIQFIPPSGPKLNLAGGSFNAGFHVVGDIVEGESIYVVEGIGQAWACNRATGAPAVVTFGAGRMRTVTAALRAQHSSTEIVLVPDRGKEREAASIAKDFDCRWCEMPSDKGSNYDANDFAQEAGYETLRALLRASVVPPTRYKLLSADALTDAKPLSWMIRGLFPSTGFVSLFGPSGSGKSFLMLDLAIAVAGGAHEWFGRRVTKHPVTYCVLEGEAGMGKRLKAWSKHHGKPIPAALRFVAQPFDLMHGVDVPELAQAIMQSGGGGGLIILDTLNRAAAEADENTSKDMGIIISACKELQELCGGVVCVVHHTGKNAQQGLRGHSSLYAALDAAIGIVSGASPSWVVMKSKDDAMGTIYPFTLDVVVTGEDEDGEEITSCVAVSTMPAFALKSSKALTAHQQVAKNVLWGLLQGAAEDGGEKPNRIPIADALTAVANQIDSDAKHKRERAKAAIDSLIKRGMLDGDSTHFWIRKQT